MKKQIILTLIIFMISITSANAAILSGLDNSLIPIAGQGCSVFGCTMMGNIDMNGYTIYNVTLSNVTFNYTIMINSSQIVNPIWLNITGGYLTGNLNMTGNDITNIGTLNANILTGNLDSSYIINPYWLNITDQRYNDTLFILNELLNYYNITEVDNLLDNKLDINDQRYNDTTLILTVNQTVLNELAGKLNLTDQRYNQSNLIYLVNSTVWAELENKLNLTDQRFNDSYILGYTKQGDGIYLYNDTSTIYLNVTAIGELVNISINGSFPPFVAYTNVVNTFNDDQIINEGYKLSFRDSLNDTFFFYNSTNKTLQLIVNGVIQQDWGASTRVYGKATFFDNAQFENITGQGVLLDTSLFVTGNTSSTYYFGSGLYLTDVCLENGSNCEGVISNINFSVNQTLNDYLLKDDQRYNNTLLIFDVNQSLWDYVLNSTTKKGDGIYLYNDSTTIYFNETKNNETINNIAENRIMTYNFTLSSGNYSALSNINISYQITQITVIPNSNTTTYRFELLEYPSYNVIERDLIPHKKVWNIEKSYALNNQILANITQSSPADTFNVIIKYLSNGVSI